MPRTPGVAPPGYFTLADTERITRVSRKRLNFWCSPWGAGLLEPAVDPGVHGRTKLLSERDLVKVALIPQLLAAGLGHDNIRHMFKKATAAWWDLSEAQRQNEKLLDWIVLVWDWQFHARWYLVASAHAQGPSGPVAPGAMKALKKAIDDATWKAGPIRGFQVIEMSNFKRELLDRIRHR